MMESRLTQQAGPLDGSDLLRSALQVNQAFAALRIEEMQQACRGLHGQTLALPDAGVPGKADRDDAGPALAAGTCRGLTGFHVLAVDEVVGPHVFAHVRL